jgi:hypothetical protein
MPRQKFEDVAGGDTLLVDVVDEENGYRQCTFRFTFEQHQESFNNIPNIKCFDDDIILNSYPKTGTYMFIMLTCRSFLIGAPLHDCPVMLRD